MRPSQPVRHFWPARNQRFFCLAADAAFYSARNEAGAIAKGVKRVCIPNRSTKSPVRNPVQESVMRPYWKGYLKLALVSCPIALHAATSTSERIAFRQINKLTGNRLRQQLVDEETREPVASKHKGRGYELPRDST